MMAGEIDGLVAGILGSPRRRDRAREAGDLGGVSDPIVSEPGPDLGQRQPPHAEAPVVRTEPTVTAADAAAPVPTTNAAPAAASPAQAVSSRPRGVQGQGRSRFIVAITDEQYRFVLTQAFLRAEEGRSGLRGMSEVVSDAVETWLDTCPMEGDGNTRGTRKINLHFDDGLYKRLLNHVFEAKISGRSCSVNWCVRAALSVAMGAQGAPAQGMGE